MKLALAATFGLWASVPFLRPVTEAMRSAGWLRGAVLAAAAALLMALRLRYPPRSSIAWGLIGFYVSLPFLFEIAPEEMFHLLTMPLLTCLWSRAIPNLRAAPWYAAIIATAACLIEEGLQRITPGRIFDWRDIAMAALSASLTAAYLTTHRRPRA